MAVITISRQYGSLGDEIVAQVCERLEYRYFDKVLMAQVASEMGLSETEIVDFSEDDYQARSFLERLFGRRKRHVVAAAGTGTRNNAGATAGVLKQLDEEKYIRMVRGTIEAAHARGDVVIVGRGGQVILRDKPGVLHVRIEAPQDVRFSRVLNQPEFSGLMLDHGRYMAKEKVKERDRAAADYLKRFYNIDWSDPKLYHLVIDTERWRVGQAACFIASGASCL